MNYYQIESNFTIDYAVAYIVKAKSVDEAQKIAIEKRLINKNKSVSIQNLDNNQLQFNIKRYNLKTIRIFSKGSGRSRLHNPILENLFEDFYFLDKLEKVDYIQLEKNKY